jgi:hypothetical protein
MLKGVRNAIWKRPLVASSVVVILDRPSYSRFIVEVYRPLLNLRCWSRLTGIQRKVAIRPFACGILTNCHQHLNNGQDVPFGVALRVRAFGSAGTTPSACFRLSASIANAEKMRPFVRKDAPSDRPIIVLGARRLVVPNRSAENVRLGFARDWRKIAPNMTGEELLGEIAARLWCSNPAKSSRVFHPMV